MYAGVSKDWNLIHVHWIFAKLFGFRRAIVHGMWTLATAIAWAEEQGLTHHKLSCSFFTTHISSEQSHFGHD